MPRRCVVPGCKSNYDKFLRRNNSVTTFSFPKDEETKQAWIDAIQRPNWEPSSHSSVCGKHFEEDQIDLYQVYKNPTTGEMQQILVRNPKLKEGAVPTIFNDVFCLGLKGKLALKVCDNQSSSVYEEKAENNTMNCCVPGCQTKWVPGIKLDTIFHRLPSNIESKIKWYETLGLANEQGQILMQGKLNSTLVCSNHFRESDYRMEGTAKRLKPNTHPCFVTIEEKATDDSVVENVNFLSGRKPVTIPRRTVPKPPSKLLKRLLKPEVNTRNAPAKPAVKRPAQDFASTVVKKRYEQSTSGSSQTVFVKIESGVDETEQNYISMDDYDFGNLIQIKEEVVDNTMTLQSEGIFIKEEPDEEVDYPDHVTFIQTNPLEGVDFNIEPVEFNQFEVIDDGVKEEIVIKEENLSPLYVVPEENSIQAGGKLPVVAKTVKDLNACTRAIQTTFVWKELPEIEEENEVLQKKIDLLRSHLKRLTSEADNEGESFTEFVSSMEKDESKSKFYIRLNHAQLLEFHSKLSPKDPLPEETNLQPIEELVLVMMRMRSGLSALDLSYRFDIPVPVCKAVFKSWIGHSYERLLGAERSEKVTIVNCIKFNFQLSGKQQPKNNHEVVKVLIASNPDGSVWFVSGALDVAINDGDLVKESGLEDLLEDGELVIPAKIFSISDNSNKKRGLLKFAAFCKGSHCLTDEHVSAMEKIVMEKGHIVQGVVSRLKEFRLLKRILLAHQKDMINQVVFVCAYLLAKY